MHYIGTNHVGTSIIMEKKKKRASYKNASGLVLSLQARSDDQAAKQRIVSVAFLGN